MLCTEYSIISVGDQSLLKGNVPLQINVLPSLAVRTATDNQSIQQTDRHTVRNNPFTHSAGVNRGMLRMTDILVL